MSLFFDLFTKSRNVRLFSIVAPQSAPTVTTDYLRAYSGWVYACTRAIATEVATIELELQQQMKDSDWQKVDKVHPAIQLLHRVNPFMTSDELWFAIAAYQELTGKAFVYVAYNNKQEPTELWVMDPTRMAINKSPQGGIASYTYSNDKGQKVELQPWEVIPFRDFNPLNLTDGWGTVKAAAMQIDIDTNASKWNRDFFYNSAIPTFAIETEQNLSDEQYQRLITKWKQKHQGLAKAHEPAVLEGGLKVNVLSHSPKELDFIEQQKYLRDTILAIFGVPKSVLGITEDVNRANAEAGEYTFAKRVTYPRMRFIATTLSEFYLPLWKDLTGGNYRLVAKDIVPQNVDSDIKRRQAGIQSGYYTINEVRAEEGLDAVDGGDETLVPTTLQPLSKALTSTSAEGNDDTPASGDATTTAPKKQLKAAKANTTKRQDFIHTSIAHLERQVEARFVEESKHIQQQLKTATKAAGDDTSSQLDQQTFAGWSKFIDDLNTLLSAALGHIVGRAGSDTALSISISAGFDANHQRVVDWLREHSLESATQIASTLQADMRPILQAGVAEGKSTAEIAKDLSRFFDDQSQWRATRIARTEVIEAYAQGSQEAARQIGVKEKKWLTAGDGRVDEHCRSNEAAGWIAREDAFPTGHIAPVTHPNCRCTLIYRNEGE